MSSRTFTVMRPNLLQPGCLRLEGFTPLLEDSADGSRLRPHLNQTLLYPESLETLHTLITGKPGSGKTTRVIERMIEAMLRDPERSLIVIDPGRVLEATVHGLAATLRPQGIPVFHFDWLDPEHCVSWNVLETARDRGSAARLSKIIAGMTPVGSQESYYFHQRAERLLTHLLLALRDRDGAATLRGIQQILEEGEEGLLLLGELVGSQPLRALARQAVQSGNHNAQTTFSELESWFHFVEDERVIKTTATSSFAPAILEEQPCVVYVGLAEESVEQVKPVLNLFLRVVLDTLIELGTNNGGTLKRPVSVVVDECPRMGRIWGLEAQANTLRKRRVGLTFALQTTEQLRPVYGEAAASFKSAFNNHIFIPPVSEADALRASERSGVIEVVQAATEPDGVTPTQLMPYLRPLLTAHEVSYAPPHPRLGPLITFHLNNLPMFQGYLRASWEFDSFREAKENWHPGLLPVVPAREEPRDRLLQIPRAQLADGEIAALVPALVENVCQTLSRTAGSWPVAARAGLWRELEQGMFRIVLLPLRKESPDELRSSLLELKGGVLDWLGASREARDWWTAMEQENRERPDLVLFLAVQLAVRQVTIREFHQAALKAKTKEFDTLIRFLDYWRCLSEDERNMSF